MLMELTTFAPKMVAQHAAEQLSGELVHVMINRFEMSPAELYTSLMAFSKVLANLPMNSINYVRIVDDTVKTFTDGMHIRL
jgi:hypothetical protein